MEMAHPDPLLEIDGPFRGSDIPKDTAKYALHGERRSAPPAPFDTDGADSFTVGRAAQTAASYSKTLSASRLIP